MVIVSIKAIEKLSIEWIVKARIVFRGDAVRDEENQAAVFDDIAASAPTSLGGLNLIVAYMDFLMATKPPPAIASRPACNLFWVPPSLLVCFYELVQDHAKHIHQPCAPLIKSLFGHPLASASWQNHLSKVLAQELGEVEFEQLPSCFSKSAIGSIGIVSLCRWFDVVRSSRQSFQVLGCLAKSCAAWRSSTTFESVG